MGWAKGDRARGRSVAIALGGGLIERLLLRGGGAGWGRKTIAREDEVWRSRPEEVRSRLLANCPVRVGDATKTSDPRFRRILFGCGLLAQRAIARARFSD